MNALQRQLIADIKSNGPLPFADYMEYCLYAPGHGYYDSGRAIFGAEGDFITAPEIGSLFARTLARFIADSEHLPNDYDLLELGAGSGKLAADLLQALQQHGRLPWRYRIVEKSPSLRQRQQQRLDQTDLPVDIEWLDDFPEKPWQGMVIANEVLDALAVEKFRVTDESIERLAVTVNTDEQLGWLSMPADAALEQAVSALRKTLQNEYNTEWPLPYTSEICLELPAFFQSLSKNLTTGQLLFIDYGYLRHEFYHPQRHMGTLVSHTSHQGHFDVLDKPGEQDITAFVDFSAVMDAAEACGLKTLDYQTQGIFLVNNGIDEVIQSALSSPSDQKSMTLMHEMKQLVLPDEMGEKFKAITLIKH